VGSVQSQWSVVSGRLSVVSGQWSVVSVQWSVFSGQLSVVVVVCWWLFVGGWNQRRDVNSC